MNAPFYKFGLFGDEVSLIIAFVIGIGFGFVLERAGFGSSRKLAAQFYFTDLSVLKVMFTAIVTAMVGLYLLSRLGLVDLSLVYLVPTFLLPQIVGGLILGIGFVIGGYCPGTSCVSAATGRIDGMVYLAGIVAGLVGFAEFYPSLEHFVHTTSMGQITLPKLFNISYGLLVFAVVLMALGAFLAAEWAESRFGGKPATPGGALLGSPLKLTPVRALALGLAVLGLGAALGGNPYRGARVTLDTRELALIAGKQADQLAARELADWIIQGKSDYTLVDLRDEKDFASYHIPTARNVPLATLDSDLASRNEKLVLYSGSDSHAAQAWLLLKAQDFKAVYSLSGGLAEWQGTVLFPRKPANPTPEQLAAFEKQVQVAKYFGGAPQGSLESSNTGTTALPKLAPPSLPTPQPQAAPDSAARPKKKKEGC